GDVERGTAEVACDQIVEPGRLGERGAGDYAGGGAGQRSANGQLARGRGGHDAAVRLYDMKLTGKVLRRQRGLELTDVGGDNRLQISVERGGRGSLKFANFRQYLVRGGDERVGP